MKRIYDLTELEVYKLNTDEVEGYIEIEKILAGVKLESEVVLKPLYPEIAPTSKVYKVGLTGDKLVFKSLDEVEKFIEGVRKLKNVFQVKVDYDKNYNSLYSLENGIGSQSWQGWDSIETISVYSSQEEAKDAAKISNLNKEIKQVNEENLQNKAVYEEEASKIITDVYDYYNRVCHKFHRMERMESIFKNSYLPVAEGDVDKAIEFMKLAYSIDEETELYLREN